MCPVLHLVIRPKYNKLSYKSQYKDRNLGFPTFLIFSWYNRPNIKMSIEISHFNHTPLGDPEKVIVVGAGIAGLDAAIKIRKQGSPVVLLETRPTPLPPHNHPKRAEMTLSEAVQSAGIQDAVTTDLNTVRFLNLDNLNQNHICHVKPTPQYPQPFAQAIDHDSALTSLLDQASSAGVDIRFAHQVTDIQDNAPHHCTVTYNVNGSTRSIDCFATVYATGAGIEKLSFPNFETRRLYQNSIVAYAYGGLYEGKINAEYGNTTMFHPISARGTGKTSWVSAAGDGRIEVVHSDYCLRWQFPKLDFATSYNKLLNSLTRQGLITVGRKIAPISGFFGLEGHPHLPTGWVNVFPHGEKAMANAPTVGDAIAPVVRNSEHLASIIHRRGTPREYADYLAQSFNFRLENALTRSRVAAKTVGDGLPFLEILDRLTTEEQIDLLRHHQVPLRFFPQILLRHPSTVKIFFDIARYWKN